MKTNRKLRAALMACAMAPCLVGTANAQPVVKTASGPVTGVERNGQTAWLGIPYAAAPTGERRWRAPAAPQAWSEARPATAFGASCPQAALPQAPIRTTSEDCLFLNVWAPPGAQGKKLPVMVSIHGGGYTLGSGDLADTTSFTRDGVVMVSMNYRLGRLGHFAHPALTKEAPNGDLASFATMDQIAALEWVKSSIAAFGGDPENVTIFGCSAGGTYVNFLMASPKARGLFHKAIAQSDPFNTPWPRLLRMGGSAEADGEAALAALGYPNASAETLRGIPAEKLVIGMTASGGVLPIVDGQYLPAQGVVAFQNGAIAKVPYINSINSWEGSLAAMLGGASAKTIGANLGSELPKVLAVYPKTVSDDPMALSQALMDDISFRAGQRTAASAAQKAGLPTWAIYFDHVSEPLRAKQPGAAHCSDSSYVFETPGARTPGVAPTEADLKVARTLHAYYVNFAKTGDPNGPGLPAWPQYGVEQNILAVGDGDFPTRRNPDAERMTVLLPASEAGARKFIKP